MDNSLQIPKDNFNQILSYLDDNELVCLSRTCKDFHSRVNNYIRENFVCHMCRIPVYFDYHNFLRELNLKFCRNCIQNFPHCELCDEIYISILDLKMIETCESNKCTIMICRGQCNFRCYKCRCYFYLASSGYRYKRNDIVGFVCNFCVGSSISYTSPIFPYCSHR